MNVSPATLKMAEQAVAEHRKRLATTANKDQVRRQIVAAEQRVADIRRALAGVDNG